LEKIKKNWLSWALNRKSFTQQM